MIDDNQEEHGSNTSGAPDRRRFKQLRIWNEYVQDVYSSEDAEVHEDDDQQLHADVVIPLHERWHLAAFFEQLPQDDDDDAAEENQGEDTEANPDERHQEVRCLIASHEGNLGRTHDECVDRDREHCRPGCENRSF